MLSTTIKELRLSHNLSQKKFAERLNVTQGAVSQWEKGLTRPDTEMLTRIALEFGTSLDELMQGEIKETKQFIQTRPVTNEDIKFALWGELAPQITDKQFEEVKRFARFVLQREKDE